MWITRDLISHSIVLPFVLCCSSDSSDSRVQSGVTYGYTREFGLHVQSPLINRRDSHLKLRAWIWQTNASHMDNCMLECQEQRIKQNYTLSPMKKQKLKMLCTVKCWINNLWWLNQWNWFVSVFFSLAIVTFFLGFSVKYKGITNYHIQDSKSRAKAVKLVQ